MSKSYLTVHDYSALNVSSNEVQIYAANTTLNIKPPLSGDYILLNATGGSTVNLPSVSPGLQFNFIVQNTGGHAIIAPANTLYGSVSLGVANTGGNLNADSNQYIFTTAGSCVGDAFSVLSDGINYYVSGTVAQYNSLIFL